MIDRFFIYLIKTGLALVVISTVFILSLILSMEITSKKLENGRAVRYLQESLLRAGIKEEVNLFIYTPLFNSRDLAIFDGIKRDKHGRVKIILQKRTINDFSNLALMGVINHELGPLVNKDIDKTKKWNELTLQERKQRQDEADLFAISMVGKDAVNAYLVGYGNKVKY